MGLSFNPSNTVAATKFFQSLPQKSSDSLQPTTVISGELGFESLTGDSTILAHPNKLDLFLENLASVFQRIFGSAVESLKDVLQNGKVEEFSDTIQTSIESTNNSASDKAQVPKYTLTSNDFVFYEIQDFKDANTVTILARKKGEETFHKLCSFGFEGEVPEEDLSLLKGFKAAITQVVADPISAMELDLKIVKFENETPIEVLQSNSKITNLKSRLTELENFDTALGLNIEASQKAMDHNEEKIGRCKTEVMFAQQALTTHQKNKGSQQYFTIPGLGSEIFQISLDAAKQALAEAKTDNVTLQRTHTTLNLEKNQIQKSIAETKKQIQKEQDILRDKIQNQPDIKPWKNRLEALKLKDKLQKEALEREKKLQDNLEAALASYARFALHPDTPSGYIG